MPHRWLPHRGSTVIFEIHLFVLSPPSEGGLLYRGANELVGRPNEGASSLSALCGRPGTMRLTAIAVTLLPSCPNVSSDGPSRAKSVCPHLHKRSPPPHPGYPSPTIGTRTVWTVRAIGLPCICDAAPAGSAACRPNAVPV